MRRPPNTFYIRTYGCQMNELDSDVMAGILERRGLTRLLTEEGADLLIFNTCSIRDLAERKVMGKLGILGQRSKREVWIGVTGCMANAKKEQLFQKLPHIDFVLGTNNIHELDAVLDSMLATGERQLLRTDARFEHEIPYLDASRRDSLKAFVSIIRGCDKFCTYCVVPYTRGPEVSRAPQDIIEECRILIEKGYKEITLLGQNVNSYGKDQPSWNCLFHDLLARINALPGTFRIRFMTSHPTDITYELMQAVRDLKSLCPFVHFPVQAGSNRILKKMHRMYTREEYLEKVAMLRSMVPDVALGTDIIVGFPSETDEEFEQTYQLMQQLSYACAFLFTYSPRKGTPAMRWNDDVPESVKAERLKRLMNLQEDVYLAQRQALLGSTQTVLIEERSDRDPLFLKGLTPCWKTVLVPAEDALIGTFQSVLIRSYTHHTLIGTLLV